MASRAWSIHTDAPTPASALRAALATARDRYMRAAERVELLDGRDPDAPAYVAAARATVAHMDVGIGAAVEVAARSRSTMVDPLVHASVSGDEVEGVEARTTVSVDVLAEEPAPAAPAGVIGLGTSA